MVIWTLYKIPQKLGGKMRKMMQFGGVFFRFFKLKGGCNHLQQQPIPDSFFNKMGGCNCLTNPTGF